MLSDNMIFLNIAKMFQKNQNAEIIYNDKKATY